MKEIFKFENEQKNILKLKSNEQKSKIKNKQRKKLPQAEPAV